MTCREIADFLFEYISGELPVDVRARFERHLHVCPNCRAYLATYQATVALGRQAYRADAGSDLPEEVVSAVMAALGR